MTEFTRNLEDLNQKYPILGESIAERLSAEFPQLEHAFSGSEKEDFASGVGEVSGKAKIIALLPLNDHPKVRSALEEAFRGIAAKEGSKVALDLDIASPHSDLLGEEDNEGLSDHFLYGISPKRIFRTSSRDPQLKTLSAGIFTPRAAEIYADPGWNRLIGWTASHADGPVVILGPPLERFTELAALEKADQVLIFTDLLNSQSQEQLPDLIQKLSRRSSPQSSLRFIWLVEEEEPEKSEEKTPAEVEKKAVEEHPEAEDVTDAAAATEEIAEQLPPEEEEPPSLDESEIDRAEPPEPEPTEEKEEKAAAVSEGEQALEAGVDDEEEIFLPEELLFLDDDEKQLVKAADDSSVSNEIGGYLDIDRLPGLTDVDKGKETAAESPHEPEAGIEKAELEAIEKTPEPINVNAEGIRIEGELGGPPQQEPETEETGLADKAEAAGVEYSAETKEEEAEALYTQADPEDELEMEEEAVEEVPETDKGEDRGALEQMKSFEEALNAPSPEEMELQLDPNPLGEAAESQKEPAESAEPVEETAAADATGSEEEVGEEAGEEIPAQEAVEETKEEAPKEEAAEETPEEGIEEPHEELGEEELETLDEAELEPVEEKGAAEAPAEEETVPEPVEAEEGPLEEEAKEETPVEEAAAEEVAVTEETEPQEISKETAESTEGEAEPEATQEPEPPGEEAAEEVAVTEETAESTEGEAEPEATQEPEPPGEEAAEEPVGEKEPAGEEAEPVLEEVAEEGAGEEEVAAEAEAPAEEKEESVEKPADEDIDALLSDAAELEDIDEEITLKDLGEPEAAEVAPGVKKPEKRSRARPLATVAVLLILAAGMFIIWRQDTVRSFVVRRLPGIIRVQSLIPGLGGKDEEELARADSIRLAQEREAMLAAAQQYDKLAYSIQIGSYRFLPQAIAARNLLRENGLNDVYVVPLTLDSLGNWNRLYMGMFESVEKADTALLSVGRTLRTTAANFRMRGGAIRRHTPLVLKIVEASSADSLENLIQRLENNNIPTYMVKLSADTTQAPVYRLYVGAFETEQQAVYMRTKIFNLGVRAEIIQREGTIEEKEG